MNTIGGTLSDDYGWELTLFQKIREASDGIVFVHGIINWDRYQDDHSPRFVIHLIVFNVTIVEFSVYSLRHRDMD